MFQFTLAASFLAADGSEVKPTISRVWAGLEKREVTQDLEARLIRALWKMNGLAADTQNGRLPKPPVTNPVTIRLVAEVTEDGAVWSKSVFEWPNMGDEQQAMTFVAVSGELSVLPESIKAKETTVAA